LACCFWPVATGFKSTVPPIGTERGNGKGSDSVIALSLV